MGRITYKTLNQPRTQGRPSSTALGVRLVMPFTVDGARDGRVCAGRKRATLVAPAIAPSRRAASAGGGFGL